jgi:uncharacterized repeat protein (TIGR02543 family)
MRAVSITTERGTELTRLSAAAPRRLALLGALIAMVSFVLLSSAGHARADINGQLDAWGEFGDGAGKMLDPSFMGADTGDGSVFVASYDFGFTETRIQKFSQAGDFEGSASLPGFEGYVGIAVDPANHRFYVLEDHNDGTHWIASKILAFDTAPQGGVLKPATVPNLPVPTGSNELVSPQSITVDPSTGDLVILAENDAGKAVLQRIDVDAGGTGTVGAAFVDAGGAIGPRRAIAISPAGVTYVVSGEVAGTNLEAATLPAGFTGSSTLTPLPGFANAVPATEAAFYAEPASAVEGVNYGSQVALTTSPGGEETLFWKTNAGEESAIRGYSVAGESLSVLYGSGSTEGSCKVQAKRAVLAAGSGGNLVVLDQGEEVFDEGTLPTQFPIAFRFGPGGTSCPAPAAAFAVESGGHPVTSVSAGSAVTLNGSGSELKGATLEGVTWKVSGAETFSETGSALTSVPAGRFDVEGTYSIRLIVKANKGLSQSTFSAPAQTLQVTPGSGTPEFPLSFNSTGTGSGTFECAVDVGAAGPCLGAYPEGASVTVTPKPAAGSRFVNWTGDCTGAGTCTVTMTAAHGIGAVFDLESVTPPTEFALTVTAPINGNIACNGGRCAAKYPAGTVVAVTAAPAAGYEFAGWTGDCLGATVCTLTMNTAHAVGASFRAVATTPPGGGGGGGNGGSGGGSNGGGSSQGGPAPKGGGPTVKTPAQELQEKRRKAIAKCKKLKGKSKTRCLKKANQIGKPKSKHKK